MLPTVAPVPLPRRVPDDELDWPWVDIETAATETGVSASTLRKLWRAGRIQAFGTGKSLKFSLGQLRRDLRLSYGCIE